MTQAACKYLKKYFFYKKVLQVFHLQTKKKFLGNEFPVHFMVQGIHFHKKIFLWFAVERLMKFWWNFVKFKKVFQVFHLQTQKKFFFGNGFPVHFMVQGIHFHQKMFLGFAVERLVKFCEKISSIVGRIWYPHFSSVFKWCQQSHPVLHVTNVSICAYLYKLIPIPLYPCWMWMWNPKHNSCWHACFPLSFRVPTRDQRVSWGGWRSRNGYRSLLWGGRTDEINTLSQVSSWYVAYYPQTLISLLYWYRVLLHDANTILFSPF